MTELAELATDTVNAGQELVGYGQPPLSTRFKKGQSGNPKGRPKSREDLPVILREMLYQQIPVRQGQRVRRIPKILAAFEVCLNNALKGDHRALERLMQLAIKLKVLDQRPHDIRSIKVRHVIVDPAGIEHPHPKDSK